MAKPRFKKYSRKFLNKSKGTALIETSVEVWSDDVQCDIKIMDCFRAITLDFNAWDKSDQKQVEELTQKFDTLISELQAARAAFIEAAKVAAAYVEPEKKVKKKKVEVKEEGFEVPPAHPQLTQ